MSKILEISNQSSDEKEFQMYGINLFKKLVPGETIKISSESSEEESYYTKISETLGFGINSEENTDDTNPDVDNPSVNDSSSSIVIPDQIEVNVPTEFSVSTVAGSLAGTMVRGTGGITEGLDLVEKLEYKEGDNWIDMTGQSFFGSDSGFPLSDATSYFRITMNNVGIVKFHIEIIKVEDSSVVSQFTHEVSIVDSSVQQVNLDNETKQYSKEELLAKNKSEIQQIADELGVEVSGTKAEMADQIVASYSK